MSLFLLAGGCGPSSGSQSSGTRIRVEDGAGRIDTSSFDTVKIFTIGDSISTGFSTRSFLKSSPEENWSTGNARYDLNSHYQRLDSLLVSSDISLFRENYAQAGQKVISSGNGSLNAQATRLSEDLDRSHFNYVTILMGANDACQSNLAVSEFKSQIRSNMINALGKFVDEVDLVLLASVPNIANVLTNQTCPIQGTAFTEAIRASCPNAINNEPRLWDYMDAINEVYAGIATDFPGKVIYDDDAVFEADVNGSLISNLDCFHPNEAGQSLIAEETWKVMEPYIRGRLSGQDD